MADNAYVSQAISGYNSDPPADDGTISASNQVTWATIKTKLADPIKTLAEAINTAAVTLGAASINTGSGQANSLAGSLALTESELTIASGSVTATRSRHTLDTEANAATDDLTAIATGSVNDGTILVVSAENAARVVTLKHEAGGAGQLHLASQQDIALDTVEKMVVFIRDGTDWYEIPQNEMTRLLRVTTTGRLGIGESSPDTLIHGTIASAQVATFERTSANGGGVVTVASLTTDAKTAADGSALVFNALDNGDAAQTYARVSGGIDDATHTSEDGNLVLSVALNGALGERLRLAGSSIVFNEDGADVDWRVEGDTDTNLIRTDAGNDRVGIGTATPGAKFDVVGDVHISTTGVLRINDTADANVTVGIVINQAGNDNALLSFKSSDVAHAMTGVAEADTFAHFQKLNASDGGVILDAFSAGTTAIGLFGRHTTDDTTKSTAGRGAVRINGSLRSGTSSTGQGANANILSVDTAGTTRFIMDSDGDSHQDVGTAWTNFDTHDDVALLHAIGAGLSRPGDPVGREFATFIDEHRETLERERIVTFNEDGHHFINWSRAKMLMMGAIRQLSERNRQLEDRLSAMERMLLPAR